MNSKCYNHLMRLQITANSENITVQMMTVYYIHVYCVHFLLRVVCFDVISILDDNT